MALYKHKKSNVFTYDFEFKGQRYRGSTGHTSKRLATAFCEALKVKIRDSRYRRGSTETIRHAADADVARAQAKGLSVKVILGGPGIHWKHLATFFGEDSRLAEITLGGINTYIADRRHAGIRGQTIQREITTLKRGMKLLGVPNPEPWPAVRSEKPHAGKAGRLIPTPVLAAFLKSLPEAPRLMAGVCLLTGLRAQELRRLEASWVEGDILRLPAEATKSRRERVTGLRPEASRMVARALELGGPTPFAHDYKKAYQRASSALGQPTISLRDLRHTFASLALQGTGDVTGVMEAMGHSDLRTAARYQHSTTARAVAAAEAVAKQFPRTEPPYPKPKKR